MIQNIIKSELMQYDFKAVKFGIAFGCDTTVVSRGSAKRDHCLNDLKAHHYIDSTNAAEVQVSFYFYLDAHSNI
jgi:hypothetical protein